MFVDILVVNKTAMSCISLMSPYFEVCIFSFLWEDWGGGLVFLEKDIYLFGAASGSAIFTLLTFCSPLAEEGLRTANLCNVGMFWCWADSGDTLSTNVFSCYVSNYFSDSEFLFS